MLEAGQPARGRVIFIAYTLPAESANVITTWARAVLGDTGELRLVAAPHLHVTLVFCGRLPADRVEEVVDRTRAGIVVRRAPVYAPARVRVLARSAVALELDAAEPDRAVRGWPLGTLALELSNAGLRRQETREWTPHVTIARARRGYRPRVQMEPPEVRFAPDAIAVLESVTCPAASATRSVRGSRSSLTLDVRMQPRDTRRFGHRGEGRRVHAGNGSTTCS